MLYAAENLLLALFTSEGIDGAVVRRKVGNHQLDRMLDELPDECPLKEDFESVVNLVAYATTYRYPTATGNLPVQPPAEEAEAYFASLLKILDTCSKHFQVNVRLDQPIAGNTGQRR